MKTLQDMVIEWHKTKSIQLASEICERLYKSVTWSEDDGED